MDVSKNFTYFGEKKLTKDFYFNTTIKPSELNKYKALIKNRPEKSNLPNFLADLGLNTFEFYLQVPPFFLPLPSTCFLKNPKPYFQ